MDTFNFIPDCWTCTTRVCHGPNAILDTVGNVSVLATRAPITVNPETNYAVEYKLTSTAGPINRWEAKISTFNTSSVTWAVILEALDDAPKSAASPKYFTFSVPFGVRKLRLTFTARHVCYIFPHDPFLPSHFSRVVSDVEECIRAVVSISQFSSP
jgi:hypothetical protein